MGNRLNRKSFTVFKQLDQMDCGPACLQMVAKHYGRFYNLKDLRSRSYLTREGVSLLGISEAAEAIGLRTVGVKVSFEKLVDDAPLPCIVHWHQRHFIVVYKIKEDRVYVADPAKGMITYSKDEFVKGWLSDVETPTLDPLTPEGGTATAQSENTLTNEGDNVNEHSESRLLINGSTINGTGLRAGSSPFGGQGVERGIALLLEPTPEFYNHESEPDKTKRKSLTYLLGYLRNHKKFLFQLALGLLTGSLIQLALPFLTQSIVDVGINTQNIQFIYLVLVGQMMLFMSRMSVDFIRRWILLHLSTRINISIISDFLVKLFKLPMSFFEGKMIGDILRRIDDHTRIERFLSTSSLNIIFSFFNLIVFGVVLAIYNVPIFLVFFGFSALYVVFILLFLKKRGELDYKRFQQMADNQSSLIQTVQGMSEIKMNNCETMKRWEWERIQAKLFRVSAASTSLQQWQDAGSLFLNESKNMLITVMAALAVMDGQMTLGMMLAVQYIIGQLNVPVNDFISFTRDWQDAKISLERIGEIHLTENEESGDLTPAYAYAQAGKPGPSPEERGATRLNSGIDFRSEFQRGVTPSPVERGLGLSAEASAQAGLSAEALAKAEGEVQIQNLTFQYEGPHSPKVLDGIDLVIPEGKVTAIVGASGSGKTTLLKLLVKFYKPVEGKIMIGGESLEYIHANGWRKQCGTVMQDGFIFSDTIANNIALSDEDIDRKKLLHAVTVANIKDHIESLPLRYNTKIGANGIGLSAGQKQRLLIARAVYKNPAFLFFDEATSALDANNEKTIMENLEAFFKGRTVVVIAHRLSTVKNADQIVVLEQGKVVESGNHKALTKMKGKYFELVKNQLELGT